ncbi:MAG: membrane protein insertase YidC [Deltaproteobacteria bacterium]|nr:membrane protein insertase YidC [Deltaproteobacteria bacterium]
MKTELRMLLAVVASIAIFAGWSYWFAPEPPVVEPSVGDAVVEAAAERGAPSSRAKIADQPVAATTDGPVDPQRDLAVQTVALEGEKAVIEITNDGGVPITWRLHEYQQGARKSEYPIDLVTTPEVPPLSFALLGLEQLVPLKPRYVVRHADAQSVTLVWESETVAIEKRYRLLDQDYGVGVTVRVENRTTAPLQGRFSLGWTMANPEVKKGGFFTFMQPVDQWHPVYFLDGEVSRSTKEAESSRDGNIYWGGIESRYFLTALLPREASTQTRLLIARRPAGTGEIVETRLATAPVVLPAKEAVTQEFVVYAGPKKIEALQHMGVELEKAINYGFFSVIAVPILYLLKFFYLLIHNYGVAIILLTVLIKLLLHPITKKSMQSMRRMQQLQPELKALREKFKEDKQRLNMEMMQLFKRHKANPMGGCLPMVLQIPVYIALYQVLWNSVELYRAPFFWFYTDLSAPDPYYVTPILLGVAFFLQQKLTPSPTMDPAQQKMMMIMPLFFSVFMLFLPSGLVFYILVNTAYTVLQQWLMNRGLGFRDLLRGRITPAHRPANG